MMVFLGGINAVEKKGGENQNNQHTSTSCKRRGAVAVCHGRASDLKVGFETWPCYHFVPLERKLHSTRSLSTQVYKWVPATYFMGVALSWINLREKRSRNTPYRPLSNCASTKEQRRGSEDQFAISLVQTE